MSTRVDRIDPLAKRPEGPDRVFYATGVLLDAEDFEAEQVYHRARLARALAYAHGTGTVAGLGVVWEEEDSDGKTVDRVRVEPGIAIDRVGRIIEVPGPACIRLRPWYDAQKDGDLADSYHDSVPITPDKLTRTKGKWTIEAGGVADSIELKGVIVDVFVRFMSCERGKTPAFASGPFDATDAVQPSRLRDGYELTLVPRVNDPSEHLPKPAWPALDGVTDPAQRRLRLQDAILGHWPEGSDYWTADGVLAGVSEHLKSVDPTAVFLARMVLPATTQLADVAHPVTRPVRDSEQPVRVNNHLRSFVYTAGALAQVLPWTTQSAAKPLADAATASTTGLGAPSTPGPAADAEQPGP
jgi:hypothetical protein